MKITKNNLDKNKQYKIIIDTKLQQNIIISLLS